MSFKSCFDNDKLNLMRQYPGVGCWPPSAEVVCGPRCRGELDVGHPLRRVALVSYLFTGQAKLPFTSPGRQAHEINEIKTL